MNDSKSTIPIELMSVPGEEFRQDIYGVRYPDGSVDWVWTRNYHEPIADIVNERNGYLYSDWEGSLRRQAKTANIDPDAYIEQHIFIKGVLVVNVESVEDVTPALPNSGCSCGEADAGSPGHEAHDQS